MQEAEQGFVAREEEVRPRPAQADRLSPRLADRHRGRQTHRHRDMQPAPAATPLSHGPLTLATHPRQVRVRLAASKEELGKAAEAELSEAAVLAAEAALDDEFASREEALEGKVGTPSLTRTLI